MNWITFETTIDQNTKLAFYNSEKTKKIEIMNDGRVIVWYRDSIMQSWWRGELIYNNQTDYNNSKWLCTCEIDYETKNPRGIVMYQNGNTYDGEWKDGKINGFGKFKCRDYDYTGNFKNGNRHGLGFNKCHHDGSTYEGEWVDDEMNGQGKYNNVLYTYVGTFEGSDANGYGKQIWHDGAIYEGIWVNGLMNGEGTYTCKSYKYVGEFVDDLCEGMGNITWSNGNSYNGEFINDNIDLYYDKGVFTFVDGSKYIGCLNKIWNVIVNPDEHKI